MLDQRYIPGDKEGWRGRVDSTENYDAFRWHQWVQPLDLTGSEPVELTDRLGFAFIGFCCDEGIRRNQGRPGAQNGPAAIRKEMSNLPCRFAKELLLFDAGNVVCQDGDLAASQATLGAAVKRIRQLGLFPLVLGGGHEVALGHYQGHRDFLLAQGDKPEIGIINFDAHFDLRPLPAGGSSGTMFRQIAEDTAQHKVPFRYLCLGIQEYSNTLELFKTAQTLGVSYVLERQMQPLNDNDVIEAIDAFLRQNKQVFVTICADVFSAAFAPGVSAIQPLGLNPEQVIKYLKYIIRSEKVVGFDIAEVSPRFDQDSATASLAKVLVFAFVNTICRIHGLAR